MTEVRKVQTSESVKAAGIDESASQAEPLERSVAVVNLGKKKRKDIRKLRKGRGRLMRKVQNTLEDLEDEGFASSGARTVIVIVERKRRRGSWNDRPW